MNLKIFAPALATLMLAGTAYAQSPSPAADCKTGDLNCPTPMNQDNTAPVGTGRSATEAGNPDGTGMGAGGAAGAGGMSEQGTPAERNSPAAQETNPTVQPNDQGSSK